LKAYEYKIKEQNGVPDAKPGFVQIAGAMPVKIFATTVK
jgi:hypothetical protein